VPVLDIPFRQHRGEILVSVFDLVVPIDFVNQFAGVKIVPILFNHALRTLSVLHLDDEVLPLLYQPLAATTPNILGAAPGLEVFLYLIVYYLRDS
jgi:hypothetical protein